MSSSRPSILRVLDQHAMDRALTLLDEELGQSELITAVAPVRLISVGGFLAVKLFHNRETTTDIDVLIDPSVDADGDYRTTVLEAINAVSKAHGFAEDWLNDQLRIFVKDDLRMLLFLESIQQNVLVYAGENLQIYAARLDFALERKLRRIAQRQGNRNIDHDVSDALAIVHHMVSNDGGPLSKEECVGLDENGFGLLIDEAAVDLVAERYLDKYGAQGIVRMGWDAGVGRLLADMAIVYYIVSNDGRLLCKEECEAWVQSDSWTRALVKDEGTFSFETNQLEWILRT